MSEDKLLPQFPNDDDAEAFVGSADLTAYDLSALTPTGFEFLSKDAAYVNGHCRAVIKIAAGGGKIVPTGIAHLDQVFTANEES
jgi:hypothetical protein